MLAMILLAMASACSSQTAGNPPTAGAQGASADAGQSCALDVKRVCQEMRNRPVIDSATGQEQDRTEREQNGARTDIRFVSYQIPNGSLVEVQCDINNEHNTVVYAHLMPGLPLTATDIAFIRQNGYCAH